MLVYGKAKRFLNRQGVGNRNPGRKKGVSICMHMSIKGRPRYLLKYLVLKDDAIGC